MKKIPFILIITLLVGCFSGCGEKTEQYSVTWLDLFDTATTVTGRAESEEVFKAQAQQIYDELLRYHRLFDIYHEYQGLHNLKTVNDRAGIEAVPVDKTIIELLLRCREFYDLTEGKVNVAMGSVLSLWHEARNAGTSALPDAAALEEAASHTGIHRVIIDEEASTVFLSDGAMSLDVGAVAKGWAAEQAARNAPAGMLINVGGNIRATGPKDENGSPWVIGIQNPDGGDYLRTLNLTEGSAVTSGDYQRFYTVDGKRYHHIIDPDTLYPSEYWRSVTIICADSALADALSTALFLMPRSQGQALLDQCGAEAMWVDPEGKVFYSTGFEAHIR